MRLLVVMSLATLAFVDVVRPQSTQKDAFEVASVRPNRSGDVNTQISLPAGGRLLVVNATLKTLMRNAYGLLSFQFASAPNWVDSDKYDITAKTESPESITPDRLKPLLQSLLSDRFHLRVHWEARESPEYVLVTDRNGPGFHPYSGAPEHGMNTRKGPGSVRMKGSDVLMAELAGNLGNQLGRFVVDRTELPGHYDFVLEWDPDQTGDTPGPSLFTALREQLGLRLEPRKGPVPILVIDSVERPSEN